MNWSGQSRWADSPAAAVWTSTVTNLDGRKDGLEGKQAEGRCWLHGYGCERTNPPYSPLASPLSYPLSDHKMLMIKMKCIYIFSFPASDFFYVICSLSFIMSWFEKWFKISGCYFVSCRISRIMLTQKFTLTNSQSITKLGTNVNICSKLLQSRNVKLCSYCPSISNS